MSPWLLVRDERTVEGACRQASELLRHGRRGNTAAMEIAGILVDPGLVADPPMRLTGRDRGDNPVALQVREQVGLAGVWILCWIESAVPDRLVSRTDVMDAWLATSGVGEDRSAGRIPVLAARELPRARPALRLVQNTGP